MLQRSSSSTLPQAENGLSSPPLSNGSSSLSFSAGSTRRRGNVRGIIPPSLPLFCYHYIELTSHADGKWPGQLNVFGNARSATMSFVPLPTISGSSSQVAESVSSGSMTATTQRNTPIPKSARSIKRQKAEEAFRGVRTAAVTPTGNEQAKAPVEKVQGRGQ